MQATNIAGLLVQSCKVAPQQTRIAFPRSELNPKSPRMENVAPKRSCRIQIVPHRQRRRVSENFLYALNTGGITNQQPSPVTGSGSCCMNCPPSVKCGRMPPIVSNARMWLLIMRVGTGPLNSIILLSIFGVQRHTKRRGWHQRRVARKYCISPRFRLGQPLSEKIDRLQVHARKKRNQP